MPTAEDKRQAASNFAGTTLCTTTMLYVLNETLQYWRNPNYNWMRMVLAVVVAIIFSSSFIGAGEVAVTLRWC